MSKQGMRLRVSPVLMLLAVLVPVPASAWTVFGGLGASSTGATGRLDAAWELAPAWQVEAQLTSGVSLDLADVRLSAAGGVRWTPVRWGPVEPQLWLGVIHSHEMSTAHVIHAPLHAVLGSDGHTLHRNGAGMGLGLVVRPFESVPLQVGLKSSAFIYLADGRAPFTWELVGGLGWNFD